MPGIFIPSISPKRQSLTIDASNNIVLSAEGAQSAALHITSTSSLAGVWEGTMTDINALVNNAAVGESGADWFDLSSIQTNDTAITTYLPLASVTPTDDDTLIASTQGALFVRFRRTAGSGTADAWVSNVTITDVQSSAGAPAGDATAANQVLQITQETAAATSLAVIDDWDSAASDSCSVSGDTAHGSSDAGEPVKVGGKASSSEPTAVTTGQRANFYTDLVGKHIVLPYANPENFVSGAITTAMTGTTSTQLLAAPASGLRNYVTQITVSCAHATQGTDVNIEDGSGGTVLYVIPAAALYGGAVIQFPTPLRQPTTATALHCANVTTGSSTKVSATGYKGA